MSYAMGQGAMPSMANVDEHRWVIQIRRSLEEELDEEDEFPVCIFNVPKVLMFTKKECYEPQMVAIGPYYHWRQEIFDMERYKLAAAKRTQKRLTLVKFKSLVEQLSELEQRIRGCYHKYLDYNGETLTWMMTLDLSFLLEILQAQVYTVEEGRSLNRVSSGMSHLVDYSGRKSAYNAILRDIVMLENQVPLFVLRKVLEVEHSSIEVADDVLRSMLAGLCRKLSPFNNLNLQYMDLSDILHLLDFLYKCIIPDDKFASETVVAERGDAEDQPSKPEGPLAKYGYVKEIVSELWQKVQKLQGGPVQKLEKALFSRLISKGISRIPRLNVLAQLLKTLFFQGEQDQKPEEETKAHKPPSVEQIMIPSVTELHKSGVQFRPSYGDIQSTSFDSTTGTLMLPIVCLDSNTEVVLRNLVAYEASTATGPLIFARYTEFMNGIINTEIDAKLLRDKGIILNHLKSDREVADLWNGMCTSVRLTKVPWLDRVIDDVNKYYTGKWGVKVKKLARAYVFGSWKFLTFLAAIFLLLLTGLQAFCSVYNCDKVFHIGQSLAPLVPAE